MLALTLSTLTTLLLTMPLVLATPSPVMPFQVHPGLLPRQQQDLCKANGRAVCDNSCMAIGSNCCGKGDGTYCLAGTYCTTGGCCTNGRICTGQAGTRTNAILTGTLTVIPTSTARTTSLRTNAGLTTSSRLAQTSNVVSDGSSRLGLPSASIVSESSFSAPSFSTPSLPALTLPSINSPTVGTPSVSSPLTNPGSGAKGLSMEGSVLTMVGGVIAAVVGGAAVLL